MDKKYYLGIDAGVGSVGIAVTDEDYNVLKVGQKPLLCVRLFDEAKTAQERRMARVGRRRIERRRQRLLLLQSLFAEEVAAVDPVFFIRLNDSNLLAEDKQDGVGKYSLFNDKGFNDKQYHRRYPTVYHLRLAAIQGKITDVRLLYLAIAHILKNRGHFLYDGMQLAQIDDPHELLSNLNTLLDVRNAEGDVEAISPFTLDRVDELRELAIHCVKKRELSAALCERFGAVTKQQKALVQAMAGMKFHLPDIFGADATEDKEGYGFEDYEANEGTMASALNETDFAVLAAAKLFYDWIVLQRIRKNYDSLSEGMIALYDKHHADLRRLKRFVSANFDSARYDNLFGARDDKKVNSYTAYIGGGRRKEHKVAMIDKVCTKEDFYKTIRALLKDYEEQGGDLTDNDYAAIKNDVEEGIFMPKVVSKDNAGIPYQLHLDELTRILRAAQMQFPFLSNADKDGTTVAEKIEKLLTFRIPYYVGPLNPNSPHAWVVRRQGSVFPWNYDSIVDEHASEERFIRRMTNKCSILRTCDVLPKNSPLYAKYCALNELNKIKINSEPISVAMKQYLFDTVYLDPANKKITVKKLVAAIRQRTGETVAISGYNEEIKGNMGPYLTLKGILHDSVDTCPELAETIVKYLTIHSDKRHVITRLREEYPQLTDEQLRAIRGLNYAGLGALSKELLTQVMLTDAQGNRHSVIELLYETNKNLNEIIFEKEFGFSDAIIDWMAQGEDKDITYDDVKQLYCSPSVKRAVWQAFKMAKEVEKVMKRPPAKVFIEVTRAAGEKGKRIPSRLQQVRDLYLAAQKDAALLGADLARCQARLDTEQELRLRSDKIFLYYLQLGRCAYSGEEIDLTELDNYDIDHIIPRAVKKDDSIDNRVLVKGKLNKDKADIYPLPESYRTKGRPLWDVLRRLGTKEMRFMSEEKYRRLMRVNPLTDEEMRDFVNRQVVETGQTAIAVADLFSRHYRARRVNTEVQYVKASAVHDFRGDFRLTKSRDINDFHHAYDAYLNIVVGNVLSEKFQHNPHYWENAEESKSPAKVFLGNVRSWREGKRYVWVGAASQTMQPTIVRVRQTCQNPDVSVTRLATLGKGAFYDANIKGKGADLVPLVASGPRSDPAKYGGWGGLVTSYFVVVRSRKGKKQIVTLVAVPILYDKQIEAGRLTLLRYLADTGLQDPQLVYDNKIRIQSLLSIDGNLLRIAGVTGTRILYHNANQLLCPDWVAAYYKQLDTLYNKIGKYVSGYKGDERTQRAQEYMMLFVQTDRDRLQSERVHPRDKERIVLVDKEANLRVYDYLVGKAKAQPYASLPGYGPFVETIVAKRDVFVALDEYKQMLVLREMIAAFQCNATLVSLELLGGNKSYCKCRMSSNITNNKVVLVNESMLGIRNQTVVLNDPKV